ncbi:unnamed protein product [Ilex paraguariensis]|uniref:CYRIA/CYRIB Rac1 binding domain-containing protein n=1 Tax=Ilex paraguariensis TaxID=185542 RepID=A0ABC8UGE4_9AQUA
MLPEEYTNKTRRSIKRLVRTVGLDDDNILLRYCWLAFELLELWLKKTSMRWIQPVYWWKDEKSVQSMLKLLDILLQLDHLKNAKASIPNDFSWYKRTFTQVSAQWQDTDSMREELDDLQIFLSTRWAILLNLHVEMFRVNKPSLCSFGLISEGRLIVLSSFTQNSVEDILQVLIVFAVESLELDFALLFPERHVLLRVLPVLVVLATSSEKDSESLYKRVKINRLINIFKNDPVVPAFPDLHLSPAAILKELSMYFPKFYAQTRLLTLPAPHELPHREAQEYPLPFSISMSF